MDIILEFTDTFVLDYAYAALFPGIPGPNALAEFNASANTTIASYRDSIAKPTAYINNFHYTPASQYINVFPSKYAYTTSWPRDDPLRQLISLYLITWIFGLIVYFVFATLSYLFVFDHETMKHPRFLKNQIRLEIIQANTSMPWMSVLTAMVFWLEVQGYTKIYDTTAEGPGLWYNFLQFPLFLAFTDFCIYWIHRGLHHPLVYKTLHKPHHKWIMPTPFASHAFHPIDGFAQSVPYHLFPFILPLQKWAYVVLFVFINFWTIMIHDGEYIANNPIINGAACHSIHHMEFLGNYGQFTTFPDRLGGTYKEPDQSMFVKEQGKVSEPKSKRSKHD